MEMGTAPAPPTKTATEDLSAFNDDELAGTQKGARVSEQPPRRGKRAATSPESRSSPRRSRSRGGTSGSNRTPAGSGMATQERRWGGDGGRGM